MPLAAFRTRFGTALLAVGSLALGGCGHTELFASEQSPFEPPTQQPAPHEPASTLAATFRVEGSTLRDRCGDEVVLRGASEMVAWSDEQDGVPEFGEMAKTGANAVRIVWVSTEPASALAVAMRSARAAGLVPWVELHDGQGDFSRLGALVDFWTAPETVAVLAEQEQALVLEIGGGLGADVPRAEWEDGYRAALSALRAAGIRVPVAIHAPGWGNDTARLLESGPALLGADPEGNLLFTFSVWLANAAEASATIDAFVSAGLPVVIGEFGGYLIEDCPNTPFDYGLLLETTAREGIGWFAWSWGGVANSQCAGALDMTTDGTLAGLQGWGLDVALGDAFGISRTSTLVRAGCGAAP